MLLTKKIKRFIRRTKWYFKPEKPLYKIPKRFSKARRVFNSLSAKERLRVINAATWYQEKPIHKNRRIRDYPQFIWRGK